MVSGVHESHQEIEIVFTIVQSQRNGMTANSISLTAGKYERVDCGYVSIGRALTLVMETDGSTTSPGFNATYVSHNEGATVEEKGRLHGL